MKVKVCGIAEGDIVMRLGATGADYIGHIFYTGSPRNVTGRLSREEIKRQPQPPVKVAVFVNEDSATIREICDECGIRHVQLHGYERPEECALLRQAGYVVTKAIPVYSESDFEKVDAFRESVDHVLFDTKTSVLGGSGEKFDWSILSAYMGDVPFFLSGGIGPEDVEQISILAHPMLFAIDINSRFEVRPGVKDLGLVEKFIEDVRQSVRS